MRLKRYILLLIVCACALAHAQDVPVRYVRTTATGGSFNNDGRSWASAKDKVQDAINDLRDYMSANSLDSGEVYIAAGNYAPTESTESSGGSLLNTSFKIYAGIHVYGGFNPDAPESRPGLRIMSNGKTCEENWADPSGIGTTSGEEIASQWDLRHKTVLTGNHTSTPPTFVFDSIRGRYNTAFPASSFHVVWFATNGKYTEGVNDSTAGHYRGLTSSASLDGCVISSGAATSRNTQIREHTAYGGGVYMVANTSLRNCIIERCVATMRGGGIYADGGGDIDFCLVQSCQSVGVGVLEGYGGGVCIDYAGSIGHSHITSCAARCGGGLMITHIAGEYPTTGSAVIDTISNYSPFASACVISNNTANAEGGGIYLAEGGTVNHCTVTANNCSGPDVTYYGRRHGRSGGIYVRNCGMIFNSVFWGNRCDVNNDIQFAAVRQRIRPGYETYCFHTAFMNHDITDWTGVRKEMVFTLEKQNMPLNNTLGNHPCFFLPTVDPLDWNRYDPGNGLYGAGVFQHLYTVQYPGPRIWHLTSYSALDQKGVQANETMTSVSYWLHHAHTDYGVVSNPYEPVSTLGALVRRPDPLTYALIAPQGYEGRVGGTPIPTLFIDPNRKGVYDEDGYFVEQTKEGNSWTVPIKDLGEAISYFRQYLVDDEGDNHHFMIPALDGDGMPTGEPTRYEYVQFLVKEGTLTTVGHGNYLDRNIRTAAIRLDSHMRLYGGYPTTLEATDTSVRNPRKYKSIISANITGIDGESGYQNNSAHVVAMVNVEHSIVDGFTLTGANTHNVYLSNSAHAGGGLLINNSSTPQNRRIHMVGNQLRNCVISNCTSPKGAAVYVNGEWPKEDGELCYAELMMQNCIIRNNTADYVIHDQTVEDHGVITANGRAYVHIEHCTVANNVGFAFKADSKTTETDEPIYCPHEEHDHHAIYHGYIRVDNSLIFCNGDRVLDNRGDLGEVGHITSVNTDGQDYVFGKWNMFDADPLLHEADVHQPRGFFANDFTVPIAVEDFMPEGTDSHFTHDISDVPADSLTRGNRCVFTRVSTDPNYPTFVNPARNVGHSETGDKPLYGGVIAYDPLTTNPCVNAAHPDDYTHLDDYDRSDILRRDRGGAPDIGAVENSDLPAAGAVIYVTPEGRGRMDGSSWDNAIAGNLVYQIGGSYVVDAINADSAGRYITTKNNLYRGGYALDYVWHSGTTNYVDKQTITQKRINLTYYEDGTYKSAEGEETLLDEKTNEQTVTTSNTLTREKTSFIYGEKSGASRDFYRTNMKDSQIASVTIDVNGYKNTDINTTVAITNNRAEDYVSGLQFAVEKAAEINKNREKDERVQVWVGNGVYEDYKGYVMRDKVEVYGGFPALRFRAPAMSERQALVSERIPLSAKSTIADSLKNQYETILQISDKKPFDASTWAFDASVMLYRDKDYTESGNKTITTTTSITIPVYYRRDSLPEGGYTDYYEVPGGNVTADLSTRITNPGFEQNLGKANWDATKAKFGWPSVTGFTLAGDNNHCAWIKNNNSIDFYQQIENLEPGLYRISVQAFNKGKAKDNVKLFANGVERVLMNISDTDDKVSVNQITYAGWFASGKYANNWVDVYVGESGHLRFGFKGSYSGTDGWTVFDNFKLERLSGGEDITTSTVVEKVEGYVEKAFSKEISAFRKPVLYMPDVCMSTWWPGSIYSNTDAVSNERRQTVSGNDVTPKPGTGYVKYESARWDGFTIRNGFVYDYYANRDGGGGVRMFESGTLAHCVVVDNTVYGGVRTRGGGAYCDGFTSEVIGCFFIDNLNSGIRHATPTSSNDKNSNGGGIYLLVGTCYNSLFANNVVWGGDPRGAGIYIEQATFYNNTIAYNTCRMRNKSIMTSNGTAVHQYDGDGGARLKVYNTIMYGNTGKAIGAVKENLLTSFDNCYVQSATAISKTVEGKMRDCTLYNGKDPKPETNPFEKGDDAPTLNNFRLKEGSGCINAGTIPADYEGEFPPKDVDFANRIQDCQIDIGAYEFNAAYNIRPDTTTHPGKAIFYVAYDSPGGDASASAPENAACGQKLQLILDAAGRYKYNLMTLPYFNRGYTTVEDKEVPSAFVANQPNKYWTVEVWMEGDSLDANTSNEYRAKYTPTRSTKHGIPGYQDNTLDYSFIVPHGVQLKGGFKPGYFHEKAGKIIDDRDPLTYRTVLSGEIVSSTGAEGQIFHVVTFTNTLFNANEDIYTEIIEGDEKPIMDQLAILTHERDRAVLDGVFIENGYANSPDPEDQIGAGAVVTDFAHVRNCVVMNNKALESGGGLYLRPYALVSGTIVKNNSAKTGGGIYIEAPASHNVDSLAHVFSSTICDNTASSSAGGLWFDDSFARVNSTVLWHNMASDNANVSGSFSRSSADTDYPFNFCAVESRRLEGQGNLELSPTETEGVRWDREDPFDAILYYPIEMSSTLARAGMTYTDWRNTVAKFPTLDTVDIAGVHRAQWTSDGSRRGFFWGEDTLVTKNNDMIEIGARAVNKTFAINVDKKYVMRRLYVMHTELINSDAARALQDNQNTDSVSQMYRQMGSSILNPFHRPGDAFDYIIAARKSDPVRYCNTVFEVFIEAGTYYPYHNAYGEQDEVRNNTFLIPEGIYVIGGIDSKASGHKYGQHGYFDQFTADSITANGALTVPIPGTGYSIDVAPLDSIRQRGRHRPMRDNNQNSVIEPWELERQTVFSGNAVSGESFTHVYHVITMHADSTKVGPQPRMFYKPNPAYLAGTSDKMFLLSDTICRTDTANFHKECDLSILGRTTEFDGIQITGGYANHLDPNDTLRHHYVTKTYFRGGGIFVDGLWTDKLNDASLPNMTEPAHYNIPIVVENCVFTDNMAGNGGGMYSNGGIYMYGCHFTQNYSQGPMTPLDQGFIPWTAGGCIATNAVCDVSNTLFDNNEARRGLYPITVKGADSIPDADARQGFGGVLSVAAQSQMRVVNCHFMKNKAVAYSSIYNFLANNRYSTSDSMQIAVNTIFWGNEVFDLPNGKLSDLEHVEAPPQQSEDAFDLKYRGSRAGVFHYDPTEWTNYENLYSEYTALYNEYAAKNDTFNTVVTTKLAELRAVGDAMEGLYFCSYRQGYGPSSMKPTKEGFLLTEEEQRAFTDPRSKNVPIKVDPNKDVVEDLDNLFSYVHGNNNTLINRVNTATDGPNFRQPSFVAGIDGYMQNADWLLARMNLTTDQGWGYLKQTVERGIGYWITKWTGAEHFPTKDAATAAALKEYKKENPGATEDDVKEYVFPVSGLPIARFDNEQPSPGAIYNFYAKRFGSFMSSVNIPLPLGDQPYMTYTRTTSDSETSGVMNRISRNPRMGESEVFIDLGIYEYQYVTLDIKGQEIDTMWVATKEKGSQHDGLTWETPTTDLQMAIDMLMSSHNNHDKYICLMGDNEGTISPSNVIDNRLAFIITSKSLQPLMPDSAQADYNYGVNSLNFLGGYSFDVKDAPRDPVNNPVVIEMPDGNRSQRNQLFVVEDMTRQMLQVNWQGEYTSRDSVVIPITFDGITFINPYAEKDRRSDDPDFGGYLSRKGGAAIYYRWQRRYEGDVEASVEPNMYHALHPDSALVNGNKMTLPKLTLSNCIFMDNGLRESDEQAVRSPAVRIDHGGGTSLIVNSLFHSNAGNPVFAETYSVPEGLDPEEGFDLNRVPNDVIIVNSTFALNDGHIQLKSADSEIHNSLVWLNDLMNDTTVQIVMGADQWDKTTNREKPGIANRMTNNAVWGCFMMEETDEFDNDSLVTDNKDIFGGPGFLNPNVTATNSLQRRERNFRLNPSAMTQNKADQDIYRNRVFYRVYPDETGEEIYWRRPNGFKSVTITTLANDSDLACKPRLSGEGMERGAYECLVELQRVLYVTPGTSAVSAGDGSSWEHSFGYGQLQNAIDAAAVYTYLKQREERENRMAYVYVKGSYGVEEINHIVARDGVTVIGGLPGYFNDTAVAEEGTRTYTNAECRRFLNYVRAYVPGVASPNGTPTCINSIHVLGNDFTTGFLMEGFHITNPGHTLDKPAVLLENTMSTLRNCLITDNTMASHIPVVSVSDGLLYNNLFYSNTADTIVLVAADGLALSNTIVANRADDRPIINMATADAVRNNLALRESEATCFAPYHRRDANPYTLPEYLQNKPSLSYQLHEHSTMINAGTAEDNLPALFDNYRTNLAIDYAHDRDVLGNPRKIGSAVDMGALETWLVEPNKHVEITAITNREGHSATEVEQRAAYLNNYGGNFYPHAGSVVYLMDSAAMTMQYATQPDFQDFSNPPQNIVLRPGYVLLRPGASFYGNAYQVQFAYLAAEKRFVNQRYSMTSFPFDYNVGNISVTTYNDELGTLTTALSPFPFTTYQYNGVARSAKDYVFQPSGSTLWLPIDTLNRTATEGYLMDFGTTVDTLLRFTAFAPEANQYVYTENALDKTVYLTQHDNRTAGTGTDLNFTRQEDMGWNMKGLPWLVSDYRTDTLLDGYDFLRQMHIPHVLYQMDGNGDYADAGDNVYSVRSWDPHTTLSMGNAFLTQTATTSDREAVVFYVPYFARNDKKPARPRLSLVRRNDPINDQMVNDHMVNTLDYLTVMPDSSAAQNVQYAYGRDAVKWMSSDIAQVYLLDTKRLSRISLLGAAPVGVDIPLGIYVPAAGDEEQSLFSFSLPEKEAFRGYPYIWLIDYARNRYTNLLEENYDIALQAGEHNNRFAIRIGGFPKTDSHGNRRYVVYASDGKLYVRGIVAGDRIAVYTTTGQPVRTTVATGNEFVMPLYNQTGYIVQVNDTSHKVLAL